MKELTPTMREAMDFALAHKGQLERFPGGYWCEPGRTQWNTWGGPSYKTSTIEALVARGHAEYTEWKDGRNGRFPVRVVVREELARAAQGEKT